MIVDAGKDLGKDVGLKTVGVQQIVLEKAASLIGFIYIPVSAVGCEADSPAALVDPSTGWAD
jgi:hypothetical protein